MKPLLLLSLLVSCLHATAQFKHEDFKTLHRLATRGWEMKTKKGALIEKWIKVNDSLLTSISYRINGKDTIPQETVELKFSNGMITYTPTVPNQNEGQPVTFILISISNVFKYTFENKEHDFPQQIIYQLGGKSLTVTINGNTANGFKEIPYKFIMM